jgi:uncharacterized protein
MRKREQILLKIKSSIKNEDPTAEIILYGSRVRGNATKMSDLDILVLIDNTEKVFESEDRFRNDLYDIELETGQIISTLVYSKYYWTHNLKFSPLYNNVNKEGIQL